MASKITWIRPSGSEITTNGLDATIEYAARLGWKPKEEAKPEPTPESVVSAPQRGRQKRAD